jgi:hypothetical protein
MGLHGYDGTDSLFMRSVAILLAGTSLALAVAFIFSEAMPIKLLNSIVSYLVNVSNIKGSTSS